MKTNILKMIEQADVEWKSIEEVFNIRNGYTPSKTNKAYWENGTIPWFRMEDIRENGRKLHSSLQKITESAVKREKLFPANSIIIATSATIGEHALITVPYLANQRFTNLSLKPEYEDKLDMEFIFHYCFSLNDWCKKNTTMSSFASVDMAGFRKYPIPIPPLELQKEIVKRLDILTELEATLEAELSLRKKQYQYYRDFLLSENELAKVGFEWKSLGEVTLPTQNIKWKNQDDLFKYIDLTSVDLQTHAIIQTTDIGADTAPSRAQKLVATDDVIFATTRPTQMRLTIIPKEFNGQIASTGYCVLRADKSQILPKWIYFNLSANTFKVYLEENQSGSAYPAISDSKVKDFKIPIPPLKTQAKIVAILDKFDRLTSSITDGLPKEIELRRKQYEYYRELLLEFARV